MYKGIFRPRSTTLYALLLVALLVPAAFASASLAVQKKKAEVGKRVERVPNLLWPLPPEKTRIRYLGSVSSNTDVEPPKKKGWLQKLINEEETRRVVGMHRPMSVAVDSSERIYVVDTTQATVFVFDLKMKRMELLGGGKLALPYGIAIDRNDNVYVSDVRHKRVFVFDRDWNLTAAVSRVGGREFLNPAGLALDEARGRLYVVDSHAHRVFACDLGRLDRGASFGERGEEDNEFNFPNSVAVDKQGNVYVTDTLNFGVKVYDKDFKFIRKIGQHGTGMGMFDRPKGVALDSEGNLYVVDASFSNFQIFNADGKLLLFVGGFGAEPGYFRLPAGIYIDNKDRIYVSDQVNSRVQIFQFLGGS
jgi:DNA-binding beta-propeller fold protein YncE